MTRAISWVVAEAFVSATAWHAQAGLPSRDSRRRNLTYDTRTGTTRDRVRSFNVSVRLDFGNINWETPNFLRGPVCGVGVTSVVDVEVVLT
jgi:hypothetical protein